MSKPVAASVIRNLVVPFFSHLESKKETGCDVLVEDKNGGYLIRDENCGYLNPVIQDIGLGKSVSSGVAL